MIMVREEINTLESRSQCSPFERYLDTFSRSLELSFLMCTDLSFLQRSTPNKKSARLSITIFLSEI